MQNYIFSNILCKLMVHEVESMSLSSHSGHISISKSCLTWIQLQTVKLFLCPVAPGPFTTFQRCGVSKTTFKETI